MYFWRDNDIIYVFMVTGAAALCPIGMFFIALSRNWTIVFLFVQFSICISKKIMTLYVLFREQLDFWTPLRFMKPSVIYSTSSKPTCDKPKAEGRRPENASEASSMRPEVYSSRSEPLPEAPTCIRPGVHWTLSMFLNDQREPRESSEKV